MPRSPLPTHLPNSTAFRWRDRPLRSASAVHEQRREIVLDVAERLFAERGIAEVSFPQLATAAGLNIASARLHFGNVAILLEGVLDRHIDRIIDRLRIFDEAAAETDPALRLTNAIGALLDTMHARAAAQRCFVAGMHGAPPHLARSLAIRQRYVAHWFAGLISAAVPGLESRTELTMPIAMSLLGMAAWHVLWFREPAGLSRDEYATLLATMVIEGARAALGRNLGGWEGADEA